VTTSPARHSGRGIWVVKIGGRLCEDADLRGRLAAACAAAEHPLVLVHGGGDAVTRLQQKLGFAPRFVEGRRVTTDEEMEAVEMVLSGSMNKMLTRDLIAAGVVAAGLSGCDAGLIRCVIIEGLGRVGEPARVDPAVLHLLLQSGRTPVVSPVSMGPDGRAVNVNADEAAAALAVALGAERLLLLSDVDGVMVSESWRDAIAAEDVESLVAAGEVTRGMIPKLRSAARSVAQGVQEVRIAGFEGGRLEDVTGTRVLGSVGVGAAEGAGDRARHVPGGAHV